MAAPEKNKNAEKWDFKTAEKLMIKAAELSENPNYDFIGEVAKDLKSTKDIFDYIVNKFPELKHYKSIIKNNCEVNCFKNMKNEKINVATGMINLKSNHGWTDRIDQNNTGQINITWNEQKTYDPEPETD